jgi:alcohol dehydrogenase class IV
MVMAANLAALEARAPLSPALDRYAEAAQLLTGSPEASARDGLEWLRGLVAELALPGLAAYGLVPGDFAALVAAAQQASSMRGNPITLTDSEITTLLEQAL